MIKSKQKAAKTQKQHPPTDQLTDRRPGTLPTTLRRNNSGPFLSSLPQTSVQKAKGCPSWERCVLQWSAPVLEKHQTSLPNSLAALTPCLDEQNCREASFCINNKMSQACIVDRSKKCDQTHTSNHLNATMLRLTCRLCEEVSQLGDRGGQKLEWPC